MRSYRAWVQGLTVALIGAVPCLAGSSEIDLVNLARLPIARVYASRSSEARLQDDAFYGVRNAFDGGRNVVNGINYSTWLPSAAAFVVVRFSEAVTVRAVVIESSGDLYDFYGSPESFWVQLRGEGPLSLVMSTLVIREEVPMVYALPAATPGVREVIITFASTGGVGEIQILGPAPAGSTLSEVTPPVDVDLTRQAAEDPDAIRKRNRAFRHVLVEMEIAKMRAHRDEISSSSSDAERALAWLKLNRGADRVADLLFRDRAAGALIEKAGSLGVALYSCEVFGGTWVAGTEGYEEYLRLFPGGPETDEAWWMSRLPNGPRCGEVDYEELIRGYADFMARFPKSLFLPDARVGLHRAQDWLKVERERRRPSG